jgi:hypothetical protein
MESTVVCVIDLAQRAHDLSGEPVEMSAQVELLDGVPHVRLVTDPASVLLPLSAFRLVSEWVAVEAAAQAIYAVEASRDANCNSLIIKMGGKQHPSTRIETYEENAESWREYARAALGLSSATAVDGSGT